MGRPTKRSQLSSRTLPVKVPSVVVDEEVDDLEVDVDAEAVPTVISESSAEVVVDSVDLPLLLLTVVLPPMVVDPQLVAMAVEAMATHLAAVVANPGGKSTLTTSSFDPVIHRHGKGVI